MEMNTRLQVEHPVTEEVTGVDIVEQQIRIAAGEPLRIAQTDVAFRGHAVECRINAEDPSAGFRPAPGTLTEFDVPDGAGTGRVRVETHVEAGYVIPPHYDSLIAKVIAWGESRGAALDAMAGALSGARIAGVPTTVPFHLGVLADPAFRAGDYDVTLAARLLARPAAAPS
jgi:acetyl-CoA carboxylase biotin carboxylase subunit